MYTKEEMEVLDRVAEEVTGWRFNELPDDDQDLVYCTAADRGLI